MYQVESTIGENLTKVLLDILSHCYLPIENLRGQCYDGASNMSSLFNGVQKRIKDLEPRALYVHCNAHALNLVLQEAVREVPVIRDSMDYLHQTLLLLGRSAKRRAILEALSANIKAMCPTCWAVYAEALAIGLKNYENIMEALDIVANEQQTQSETKREARDYYEQFCKGKMYWSLLVADALFGPCDKLAKALQSPKLTINESISVVKETRNTLLAMRTEDFHADILNRTNEAVTSFEIDPLQTTHARKAPSRLDSGVPAAQLSVEAYYRQQFYMMIDKMTTCLERRILDNDDLKVSSEAEELFLNPDIDELLTNCMKVANTFTEIDAPQLAQELVKLNRNRKRGNSEVPDFQSIADFFNYVRSKHSMFAALFPEVMKLGNLLTVISAFSATAERSFSCLQRVKTWLRSSITQACLNIIALLHAHRYIQPNISVILEEFIGLNDYKRLTFGNIKT